MTSKYIAGQADYIKREQERNAEFQAIAKHCWGLTADDLPPLPMMNIIGSHDAGHFKDAMTHLFHEISKRCSVDRTSHVLDLGCGCGRLAFPYAKFLSAGRYYGFDVWKDGIEWCKGHIADRHKNCEFVLVNAKNNYYFEDRDASVANEFNLQPVSSGSIDVAFAISVFTHLIQSDSQAYLHEIARVLKKDGRAYITGFIIDRFFWDYVRATGNHTGVAESKEPGCYYAYGGQDFFGGYTWDRWADMFDRAGLEIASSETGTWAQKPGARVYQDTFIAVKKQSALSHDPIRRDPT